MSSVRSRSPALLGNPVLIAVYANLPVSGSAAQTLGKSGTYHFLFRSRTMHANSLPRVPKYRLPKPKGLGVVRLDGPDRRFNSCVQVGDHAVTFRRRARGWKKNLTE